MRAFDKAIFRWLLKTPAKDEEPEVVNDPDAEDGGPGSGNWGHKGRIGLRGGSGKGGGTQYRGGRADQGNYYSSKRDWLNGLNGERQHEMQTMLKKAGNGDIKAGEKAIMSGSDKMLKHKMITAMAEARQLNTKQDYFLDELSEDEREVLKSLDDKFKGGYAENAPLTDRLAAVTMLGTDEEARVYADLLSKAMGGETSGEEIPDAETVKAPAISSEVQAAKDAGKKLRELPVSSRKKETVDALKASGVFKPNAKISLAGCNDATAVSVTRCLGGFIEDFPFMHGAIGGLSTGAMKTMYGYCTSFTYSGLTGEYEYTGSVKLSSTYYKSQEAIQTSYEEGAKTQYHPPGIANAAAGTMMHELGHALDAYVSFQMGHRVKSGARRISERLLSRVAMRLQTSESDLQRRVSRYATKNAKEWFAESLSELKCSPKPREEVVIFGEELTAMLKEGGLL